MVKSFKEIISYKNTWIQLSEVALADQKITMDEYLIIRGFTDNIERYIELLEQCLEDNIVTTEEKKQLFDLRSRMMQDAIETANDDRVINPDEFIMLQSISELLEIIEDLEARIVEKHSE
ncbi:MAG: hypothetical protein INQ03_22385 [Candidatus Heimdallarchaeota archaeon]|nr:hypothetical protein [Candidatus Heimdallarchaeota archaeon]